MPPNPSPAGGPATGRVQKSTRNPPARSTTRINPQVAASISASAGASQMHHQAPAHSQGVHHNGAYYHSSYTFPPAPTRLPPRAPTIWINPPALPESRFAQHGQNGQGTQQHSQVPYQDSQVPQQPRPGHYPSPAHPQVQAQHQPQPQHYPPPPRHHQPQPLPTDPRPHTDPSSIFDSMPQLQFHNAMRYYHSHPEEIPDRETYTDAHQEPKEIRMMFDEGVFFRSRSRPDQNDEDVGPLGLGDGEGNVRRPGQWVVERGEENDAVRKEECVEERSVCRGPRGGNGVGGVEVESGRRESSVVFLGERRVTAAEDCGMMK